MEDTTYAPYFLASTRVPDDDRDVEGICCSDDNVRLVKFIGGEWRYCFDGGPAEVRYCLQVATGFIRLFPDYVLKG